MSKAEIKEKMEEAQKKINCCWEGGEVARKALEEIARLRKFLEAEQTSP